MKVLLRADASLAIGTGHVMRCRTLAGELRRRGHVIRFACRPLMGHLLDLLHAGGYASMALPAAGPDGFARLPDAVARADAVAALSSGFRPDWVVVDHYGLDAVWEWEMRRAGARVLAIDDLADRDHACELLLDQNPGDAARYAQRVPASAQVLAGPRWALVRPEFVELRVASLARRSQPVLERLLVFFGGGEVASHVLCALDGALASGWLWRHVDVVLGSRLPDLAEVEQKLLSFAGGRLHIQTDSMAQLMEAADLAITAAGSVSWEKCCLGLPSVVAVLADNQQEIAAALHAAGAAVSLGDAKRLASADYAAALRAQSPTGLARMAQAAAAICEGHGAPAVACLMERG